MKRDHGSPEATQQELCSDCPPLGYPTNKTRCAECPNRSKRLAHCDLCGKDVPGNMKGEVYKHKCMHRAAEQASGGRAAVSESFYVASRATIPARGRMWRALRDSGVQINSSWIDEDGEGQTENFSDLWLRIEGEVKRSAALILYAESGDFPLKGAYIEVGIALAWGIPVRLVLPGVTLEDRSARPIGSWIGHPLVSRYHSVREAIDAARGAGTGALRASHKVVSTQGDGLRSQLAEAQKDAKFWMDVETQTQTQLAETRGIAGALAGALRSLVDQIDRSNAVDDHGHAVSNLLALTVSRTALARAAGISPEKGKT